MCRETSLDRALLDKIDELGTLHDTDVAVPACCSREFLQMLLIKLPRTTVAYVHNGERTLCTKPGCKRPHLLRLSTRDVPSRFLASPRVLS
jgi:hypothetical protein